MRGCRFLLLLGALSPCFGAELIYLNSGFALEVDSHSQENQTLTCRTSTGTLEFQLRDVARIEELPATASSGVPATPKSSTLDQSSLDQSSLDQSSLNQSSLNQSLLNQDDLLAKAAFDQGLPPEFIRSVAKIESGLKQSAVSPKGAIGLMQLMPETAAALGVQPTRAEENAQGGARYLRQLLLRYHNDSALALAAYNAGPGAVDKYGGVPPYAETRQYVLKVLREYERQQRLQATAKSQSQAVAPFSGN